MAAENESKMKQLWDEYQARNLKGWQDLEAKQEDRYTRGTISAEQARPFVRDSFQATTDALAAREQAYIQKRKAADLDRTTPTNTRQNIEAQRQEAFQNNRAIARRNQAAPSLAESSLAFAPVSPGLTGEQSPEAAQEESAQPGNQEAQRQAQTQAQQEVLRNEIMAGAQQQAVVASMYQDKQGAAGQSQIQEQVQKAAKKTVKDMAGYITEAIADALDLGTGSLTFVVDFIEHAFFVTWIHLRLFVYYWDYEGRKSLIPLSKVISPLEATFGPVDLKRIIPATLIHYALICFDLLLLVAVCVFLAFGLLIILAFSKFMTNPIGSLVDIGPVINNFGNLQNLIDFVL